MILPVKRRFLHALHFYLVGFLRGARAYFSQGSRLDVSLKKQGNDDDFFLYPELRYPAEFMNWFDDCYIASSFL